LPTRGHGPPFKRIYSVNYAGSPIKATEKKQAALLKKYPGAHWLVTGFEIIKDRERLDKFPEKRPFGFVIDVSEVVNLTAEPRHIISQLIY